MSDVKEAVQMAVKFIFEKSGNDVLLQERIKEILISEQKWLAPTEADAFIQNSVKRGVLVKKEGGLAMGFDAKSVKLPPLAFSADTEKLKEWARKKDLFQELLDTIVERSQEEKRILVAESNILRKELNVYIEVALLLVASRKGIGISDLIPAVEEEIIERKINEKETA